MAPAPAATPAWRVSRRWKCNTRRRRGGSLLNDSSHTRVKIRAGNAEVSREWLTRTGRRFMQSESPIDYGTEEMQKLQASLRRLEHEDWWLWWGAIIVML